MRHALIQLFVLFYFLEQHKHLIPDDVVEYQEKEGESYYTILDGLYSPIKVKILKYL